MKQMEEEAYQGYLRHEWQEMCLDPSKDREAQIKVYELLEAAMTNCLVPDSLKQNLSSLF